MTGLLLDTGFHFDIAVYLLQSIMHLELFET